MPDGVHRSVLEKLPQKWQELAKHSFTSGTASSIYQTPSLDAIRKYLPLQQAALRQQSIRMQADDLITVGANSLIAVILAKVLLLLQLRNGEATPDTMLDELASGILQHSIESPGDKHMLLKCTNALALALPQRSQFQRVNFSSLLVEKKRRKVRGKQ